MGMQVLKMLAYPLAYYIVCCSAERQASYFVHLFVCFYFLSVFFFFQVEENLRTTGLT